MEITIYARTETGWSFLGWSCVDGGSIWDVPQYLKIQKIETTIKDLHPCTAQRKVASLRSYAKWLLREGEASLHGQACPGYAAQNTWANSAGSRN